MLTTKLSSIQLPNPLMLASGVLGVNTAIMVRVAKASCGAIVTKSIGPEPKAGYPNPTVVELGNGNLINAMGLPNPGCKEFVDEIKQYKKQIKKPIIASIFGRNTEEFVYVHEILSKAKPDAFELNISCPHGGKYGAIIGEDPQLVKEIVTEIKKNSKVPLFVKISPNLTDLSIPAKSAIDAGADGIVIINTLRAMAIDLKLRKPILANKFGGLSGPAVKPVALKCVYDLYAKFGKKIPIIGVGGISDWKDVIEFILAGATSVQLGTSLAYQGNIQQISIFKDIIDGLKDYLKTEGFKNISELIGLAHEGDKR